MSRKSGQWVGSGICAALAFALSGCLPLGPNASTLNRPDCVTLDMYSSVIEQVMGMVPDWQPLGAASSASQHQWKVEDEYGKHTLTATLLPGGCVCAAVALSQFDLSSGKAEMVGWFEGAAVAPISDLNYTAGWLEPKISFQCTLAHVFQSKYESMSTMKDGTTWKLTCVHDPTCVPFPSTYTLKVVTPRCASVLE